MKLKKKVIIKHEALIVGNKSVPWDHIIGIKEYDDKILTKVSNRFPRFELFLINGKVIAISIQNSFYKENEKIDYETAVKTIREKSSKLNPVFANWMSWRLILPIGLFELFALMLFFLIQQNIFSIINKIIIAGIIGAVVGWIWEKRGRKKKLLE